MGVLKVAKQTIKTAKTAKAAVDALHSVCESCGKTIRGGASKGANACGKACSKQLAARW